MIPDQARDVAARIRAIVGDDVVGTYLHGSFALGCGNPNRSDVDLLVVTRRPLTDEQRAALAQLPRGEYDRPGWPRPVELSVLTQEQLHPWRHPTPYDFHLSSTTVAGPGEDPDLAGHVTVARRAGIALDGPPPEEVFPEVPRADFEASLVRDAEWCVAHGADEPRYTRYAILSVARVQASLAEPHVLHTKETGATWALERLPPERRRPLELALASYRGDGRDVEVPRDELLAYFDAVRAL